MTGRRVTAIGRRAKYLTVHLEGGVVLICHLGMSGSFRIETAEASTTPGIFHHERSKLTAHDHVVFTVESRAGEPTRIIFNDPRRFGFMLLSQEAVLDQHPLLAGLGVEPTGNALSGELIGDLFRDRATPLKSALLDQRLIAGIGNIYACEAMWWVKTFAATGRGIDRQPARQTVPAGRSSRRGAAVGHRRGDRGRRLVAARPYPDRRLARLFPAPLQGLRS